MVPSPAIFLIIAKCSTAPAVTVGLGQTPSANIRTLHIVVRSVLANGHAGAPRPRLKSARSRSDRRIRSRRRVAAYDGARDSACHPLVQPPPLRPSAADERDILSESF